MYTDTIYIYIKKRLQKQFVCIQHHCGLRFHSFFLCFFPHYIINKFRFSPNVAPLFSDWESSTHAVAFYNVHTFQNFQINGGGGKKNLQRQVRQTV